MSERGKIKYLNRYKQLISYEGLVRHRNITPTDIDGFIDYNGCAFFYIEGKHEDKYNNGGLDFGQKRAIENLVNSNTQAGHTAAAIVFTHTCNSDEVIMAEKQPVREVYFQKKWTKTTNCNVLDSIDRFEKYCKNINIDI